MSRQFSTAAAVFKTIGAHRGIYAARPIKAADQVLEVHGEVRPGPPDQHSLQIGPDLHLFGPKEEKVPCDQEVGIYGWRFLVHSCDPNSRFEPEEPRTIVALHNIAAGTQISIDYNESESDMAVPFDCECGSPKCVGVIRGLKQFRD